MFFSAGQLLNGDGAMAGLKGEVAEAELGLALHADAFDKARIEIDALT